MKFIIQSIFILTILLFCTRPVGAEESVSEPLTLSAVSSLAIKNNLELRAARHNLGIANGEFIGARDYPFNPALEVEGANKDQPYRLGISQEIGWPGKRQLRSNAAEANLNRVLSDIKDRERSLIGEVKSLFNLYLHLARKLQFAEESIALNEKLVTTAEARSNAGESPGLDLNLAKVALNKAINDQRAIESSLSSARGRLNLLMGRAWNTSLVVEEHLHFAPKRLEIDPLLASAKRLRPDLLALQAEKERVRFIKELSLKDRFPNFTLSLFSEQGSRIGGKISIPLPLLNRNKGPILVANARQDQIEIEVAAREAVIAQEIGISFERFSLAQKSVTLFEEGILSQSRDNLDLIRSAYESGEVGITTVIQEQERFINTNISYFNTLEEYHAALIDLETAVGENLEELK